MIIFMVIVITEVIIITKVIIITVIIIFMTMIIVIADLNHRLMIRDDCKIIQGGLFHWYPPKFSTKKKTANQPIRAAVPVSPITKKGRDWLLGGFSF